MTGDEADRLTRARFAKLSAVRAAGVVLMLAGLWIWVGNPLRDGGDMPVGFPLFVVGFTASLILPQILARRWRTPRDR